MKNNYSILIIISLIVIVIMSFISSSDLKFYYAYNEKINLNELDNKLIVRYKSNKNSDKRKISLSSELAGNQFDWKDDSTYIILVAPSEQKFLKNKIMEQADVKSCNSVFAINTGLEMGATDEFLVKFNEHWKCRSN